MGSKIKAWTSPLLNPKKVRSVCSGMWWLAFSNRGMRSRCVVCLPLEWKRALQLAHLGILCLTHSKSLIISYSKIVASAKTSKQVGRNLMVPLPTIVWDLFFKNKLPSIRNWDPAALIGIEYTWRLSSAFSKLDGIANQNLDAGWSGFDYLL